MRLKLIAAAFVATAMLTPMAIQSPRAQSTAVARVIVKYRADSGLMHTQSMTIAGARATQMRTLGQRIGTPLVAGNDISESSHVVFARGLSSEELAAKLSADSDVEYAEPDRKKHRLTAPSDPLYSPAVPAAAGVPATGQWYLKPPGATTLSGSTTLSGTAPSAINAETAWNITTGSRSIVVAVLDTGLRFDHPDLQGGNVLPGYDMISSDDSTTAVPPGTDNINVVEGTNFATAHDGNGRDADASDPGDGITQAEINADQSDFSGCSVENSSWHGTQTLSLIGATTNNGIGMASVARNVSVMPVRVLGRCGSGYDSDILAGMLWAGGVATPTNVPVNTHPARVINLSLGSDDACSPAEQDVVNLLNAAGVVVVVSAGNSGIAVGSPANCTGAIAVTGLRSDGDKLGVSSFGAKATIAAPGGNCPTAGNCTYPILAAFNAGLLDPVAGGNYTDAVNNVFTGTSFSAPMVAGAAALMLSVNPNLTPAQIKAKLMSSARPFPTSGSSIGTTVPMCTDPGTSTTAVTNCYCTTSTCGAGMLDVHAAVMSVAAATTVSVGVTSAAPTANLPVTLTASAVLGTGATSATYTWAITNAGTTGATITSGQGTATVVVTPTAAGTFTISLTTLDSVGNSIVTNSAVVVAAAAGTTGGGTTTSSSSGGGGAIGVGWLALLLAAIGALAVADRIERRAVSVPVRSPRKR